MQQLLQTPENAKHVIAMSPLTIHKIKFFMGQAKVGEERNAIIAKGPRNCNLSANRCMPFVSPLEVEKVMHAMSRNPHNNVDE